MEGTRFRFFLFHPYIWKDLECKFMMAVPHVHLWPKEAVSNEEAIGPQERLAGDFACVSPVGYSQSVPHVRQRQRYRPR